MGVLELKNPAGPEAVEGGVYDEGGVAEAGEEGAAVDVVEWMGVVPGFFGVVYFEGAVWRNAWAMLAGLCGGGGREVLERLDGGEISADNARHWVFLR